MKNAKFFQNSKQTIAFLADRFPKCFSTQGPCHPLKIGIFNDLVEHLKDESELSKVVIRSALRWYTSSWRYLHSVKLGVSRIDLNGNCTGLVDQSHAQYAQSLLKASKLKFAKHKAKLEQSECKRDSKPRQINLSSLHVDQNIFVKVGKKMVPAILKEVCKDSIRVQLDTGAQLKVPPEYIELKPKEKERTTC